MSDHLPTLTLLRQAKIKNLNPLVFESRDLNVKKEANQTTII